MSTEPRHDGRQSGQDERDETEAAGDAAAKEADGGTAAGEAPETVRSDPPPSADDELRELRERLAGAEEEARRARDELLRVQAEMQNRRRRAEKDVEKARRFGQKDFSVALLTVMDNLELALNAAAESEDDAVRAIREGVDLTLRSFVDCLGRFNIEAVDPAGEPFVPGLHQAMSTRESPDVEPNTVLEVLQKGYTLHGQVIRPAMVIVSKDPADPGGGGQAGGTPRTGS